MSKKLKKQVPFEETEFGKAAEEYRARFNASYPYYIGHGFPARTDEENIAIIRECLAKNEPLDYDPPYRPGCDY